MGGRQAQLAEKTEEVISYLPLSHVAAQILDIHIPILFAGTVFFAQPDALRVSSLFHQHSFVCCYYVIRQ